MAAWPPSLPQKFLAEGLNVQDDESVLRTPMDAGPPSRRNRFTAITKTVTTSVIFTGTQKQTFDTFYRTTLRNGALSFDWKDPVTGLTVTYAFKQPPEFALLLPGSSASKRWHGQLLLEIQP